VGADDGALSFLQDSDRVVGFVVEGRAYAVPHNILWWHEIVNLDVAGRKLAITLCPLTGSSLGFDRSSIGGDELGVSGLLYKANLIMYNRGTPESLWPQMLAQARCGGEVGMDLARYPIVDVTWLAWRSMHPNTLVVGAPTTAYSRDYTLYPYGNYSSLENASSLGFPVPPLDSRRPPKERVLGLPPVNGASAMAFPSGALNDLPGNVAVVNFTWDGERAVLLWSDIANGGMIFRSRTEDGAPVELETGNGRLITDRATGSRWTVDGRAVGGERTGASLVPIAAAYTAFWSGWSGFFPETELCDQLTASGPPRCSGR